MACRRCVPSSSPRLLATSTERHARERNAPGDAHRRCAAILLSRPAPRRRPPLLRPSKFVKRYIDLMARYKFNTFHWHLTEDQGWRIEIKKYPRLTEVGGCRKETLLGHAIGIRTSATASATAASTRRTRSATSSPTPKARYITVIPEIEMPGHSVAALAGVSGARLHAGPVSRSRTTLGRRRGHLLPERKRPSPSSRTCSPR